MLKDDVPYDDQEMGYYREHEKPRSTNPNDPTDRRSRKERQRKVLAPVDHEEQDYEPFKKNFYKGIWIIKNLLTKPIYVPKKSDFYENCWAIWKSEAKTALNLSKTGINVVCLTNCSIF